MNTELTPLRYHLEMRDFLRDHHPVIWREFKQTYTARNEEGEIELLKWGYHLEPGAYPHLYEMVEDCRSKLGIEQPISLYQGDQHRQDNACVYPTEHRGHILFVGKFLDIMSPEEIHSTIAHELGHYRMYAEEEGDLITANRILCEMAAEKDADPAIGESQRIFQLYEEIYADRAEVIVMETPDFVVSSLVKLQMGVECPQPRNYIQQADELFEKADLKSDGTTHPEVFIRTRAAALWAREDDEVHEKIERMIEGPLSVDGLELVGQEKLTRRTWEIVTAYLQPEWTRTESTLALVEKYFEDFKLKKEPEPRLLAEFASQLEEAVGETRPYFAHVLLDLAAADPDLDRPAYAQAFLVAEQLGLGELLMEAAKREKMRPTTNIRRDAAKLVKEKQEEFESRERDDGNDDSDPGSHDPPPGFRGHRGKQESRLIPA